MSISYIIGAAHCNPKVAPTYNRNDLHMRRYLITIGKNSFSPVLNICVSDKDPNAAGVAPAPSPFINT